MPSDATHPTSAQSILKPEYIVYTMYAIGRDGLVHHRKAVIFSPLTSALTETKCKNDLLSREKTTTPYTNIFRVRSRQLCSIIQNRAMLSRYIHMYFLDPAHAYNTRRVRSAPGAPDFAFAVIQSSQTIS